MSHALFGHRSMKGKYFMVPNDIFLLGLSPGELAVYVYLLRCENRNTYQCWPSYATIGENVGMITMTEQMDSSIDRIISKSKFVVGEIDFSQGDEENT